MRASCPFTFISLLIAKYGLELYDNLEMLRHKIAAYSENYRIDKITKLLFKSISFYLMLYKLFLFLKL